MHHLRKRQCALTGQFIEDILLLPLNGVRILNHLMHRSVLFLFKPFANLFKNLHQLVEVYLLKFSFHIDACGQGFYFAQDVSALLFLKLSFFHFLHRLDDRLVLLVFQQVLDEFFAGIDFVTLLIQLRPWQEHLGFYPHQRCRHQDEFAGQLNIKGFQVVEVVKKVLRDLGDGNIVDVKLIAFNEEKQQVKGPFKERQLDLEILGVHRPQNYSNGQTKPRAQQLRRFAGNWATKFPKTVTFIRCLVTIAWFMLITPGPILAQINEPADLKKLDQAQLVQLCQELRQFIIDNVSIYGGHFGASLGVTELTVALHYVFNAPTDQIVWDVGHQAYGHKILTGRRDVFHTNRVYKGISGFPKRKESEFDAFGVGHSSTSVSAALGMAAASKYLGLEEKQHVAVIGDGALTGGIAFEGLNNAGVSNTNLLIILNDNCMSIDPNVGALKDYLTDITTSRTYNRFKDEVWNLLGKLSKVGKNAQEVVSKIDSALKSALLSQSNLFESLNLRYFGPVDGHDVDHLVAVLNDLKNIKGPKILHCVTVKGKGYGPSESGNKTTWHSPGTFDKITGEIHKKTYDKPQAPKYQDVFGHTLVELAKLNDKVVGITPAMPSGSSMNIMMKEFPERAFDVGIAEQHAVTFSAGLATQGLIPFCNIYSSFMQRAYDQVIHDVCIQSLPVNFCLDRAGFAGSDGPTHHGAYDIAYFRCIPNMIVSAPMNESELRNLMYTAQLPRKDQAFSIRYPRGQGVMPEWRTPFEKIEVGTGRKLRDGEEVAILTFGHIGNYAVEVCDKMEKKGVHVAHYDLRFAKPLDERMLHEVFASFKKVITVEDGCVQGGVGSAVLEFMADHHYQADVRRMGIPDRVIEHGEQLELHNESGFGPEAIEEQVHLLLESVSGSR